MKNKFSFLMLSIFLLSIVGCQPKVSKEEPTSSLDIAYITLEELKDYSQIIDTREPDKFLGWTNSDGVSGHIKGAIDFPAVWFKYEPNKDFINIELERRHIDKSMPTVLYGDDSLGSDVFSDFKEAGFNDLYILEGGINAYAKNNGELSRLEGYQKYVSPQWVDDLLSGEEVEGYDNDKFMIVELSLPSEKDEYTGVGHIQGAVSMNTDVINHIPGPRTIVEYENIPLETQLTFWGFPSDETIKNALEEAGITHDTTVILYATEKTTTAINRAALVMEYAGVEDVRLLNGGKKLWILEERFLEKNLLLWKKSILVQVYHKNPR